MAPRTTASIRRIPGGDGPFCHLSAWRCLRHDHRVRILAVTDLHYRLAHYDWLVAAAADVDVVALTGDLADVANPVPLGVQVVVLDRYLDKLAEQAVVLMVSGNHDLDGPG